MNFTFLCSQLSELDPILPTSYPFFIENDCFFDPRNVLKKGFRAFSVLIQRVPTITFRARTVWVRVIELVQLTPLGHYFQGDCG